MTNSILDYLEKNQIAHLSWSSQGRGYFLPDDICQTIEDKITKDESAMATTRRAFSSGPLSCYDSEDNRERKKRANKLANELNVDNSKYSWNLAFKSIISVFCINWSKINK